MDIWWRMGGAGGGEDDGGGESSERRREKRAELEVAIKVNLAAQAYIRMACTILVYLAFTWSTVVLLGGYVSSLHRKDFWYLTVITVIQATSIFNELESQDNVRIGIWNILGGIIIAASDSLNGLPLCASHLRFWEGAVSLSFAAILAQPVLVMFNILLLFNMFGPVLSIGLSSSRLRQRDYHHGHGAHDSASATDANLMRGLDFFYTLVLCHGVLYCLMLLLALSQNNLQSNFSRQCKFLSVWGRNRVIGYIRDTRERCQRDPTVLAAEGTSFLSYTVGLLESESQEDYLSGARMLYLLIDDGEDASSIILRSRPRIQRLLDMLGWCSSSNTEIRMLAARIVADLAGGVQLAEFPGAIRCVSSLLETNTGQQPLGNSHRQHGLSMSERSWLNRLRTKREIINKCGELFIKCTRRKKQETTVGNGVGDGAKVVDATGSKQKKRVGCNELVLQGLRIVERLACDPNNRRDICAAPGLLAKITAPLYSATLIQDISKSAPWANVAAASLKAVHRLIDHVALAPPGPGRAGKRLRREISSNTRAVSNLEAILDPAGSEEQLQIPAMEILTELVMDPSVNISRETTENLVRKQLLIFLAEGGQDEDVVPVPASTNATKKKKRKKKMTIKATAGETLSILSKSEAISIFIVREHSDIVDRLTARMLDTKYNIRYKTLSAELWENLCTHCKELFNGTLLQKVIKILTKPKTEASERTTSAPGHNDEEIRENSSHGDDVEKQSRRPKQTGQGKKAHGKADKASDQKPNEDEAELQQALLSLTLLIHETLVPVLQESAARDAFVDKLKAIVDDNCEETTPVSLRIVKLCCQIVISSNRYITSEQKKFLESLSKASKTMANLESCVLFAGTDCGMEKIARPLLSDLEEKLNKLVA